MEIEPIGFLRTCFGEKFAVPRQPGLCPSAWGTLEFMPDRIAWEAENEVEPPALHVSGVDLVDGTPVYDVKPYLPYAEALPDAAGGYASEPIERMPVIIGDTAREDFGKLPDRARRVIIEALSLDPRPAASPKDEGKTYGALLCGVNVTFRFANGACRITGAG